MQSIIKNDSERARAQYASLTKHYRPIGVASVAAALIYVRKGPKKTGPKPA
ncbi:MULTISPECIES: transcriptional regulator [Mesorhizobium]|uniref:Transcriptional regulator n=1 Tax=Mesorhizobium denitrificans TaxID=2294114 RepID=A0A371XIY9_9HYPH|nr:MULTISPECIES: transcriptional regulator [Mesorhizobium]RFC69179.1 transcriptional regulator [Mesorhizobium denitrificans]